MVLEARSKFVQIIFFQLFFLTLFHSASLFASDDAIEDNKNADLMSSSDIPYLLPAHDVATSYSVSPFPAPTQSTSSSDSFSLSEIEDETDPFQTEDDEDYFKNHDQDSLEDFNRGMHNVNTTIYQYFFRPVAKGLRAVIPEEGRMALGNAFENLSSPAKLLSSVVQGDTEKAGRVIGRFFINTTFGLGGLLDVAKEEYQIEEVNEDFGQALATQGVSSGDYIVLPFFGPSTTRDAFGKVVDSALNPLSYIGLGFLPQAGLTTGEQANTMSFHIDDIDHIDQNAVDPYESQRHFYLELRKKQVSE